KSQALRPAINRALLLIADIAQRSAHMSWAGKHAATPCSTRSSFGDGHGIKFNHTCCAGFERAGEGGCLAPALTSTVRTGNGDGCEAGYIDGAGNFKPNSLSLMAFRDQQYWQSRSNALMISICEH
ncbi:MAG: hypothetical protein ABIU10_03545, partial [Sphingomicrobium sp.]